MLASSAQATEESVPCSSRKEDDWRKPTPVTLTTILT